MPGKKADKGGGGSEVRTAGTSSFSMFQLLIFLIATSSMAMNFAMLYGYIPIKGKFMNSSFLIFVVLKVEQFSWPLQENYRAFFQTQMLELRSYTQLRSKSFIPNPSALFFKLLYIFKYYFRMRGSPWKNRRERWAHFNLYTVSRRIHAKFIRKKLICYNQNKRKDCSCCLCLCCCTGIHILLFYSMIFVDNIFFKFFLKFQVVRVPKENPVLPVSQTQYQFY